MRDTPTVPAEPLAAEPVPPQLLAWARQTFDVQEYLDGVRDIEATGGRRFEELIAELEARARKP
jgi:hypothetical protein